jgi:hypothetical protein
MQAESAITSGPPPTPTIRDVLREWHRNTFILAT